MPLLSARRFPLSGSSPNFERRHSTNDYGDGAGAAVEELGGEVGSLRRVVGEGFAGKERPSRRAWSSANRYSSSHTFLRT